MSKPSPPPSPNFNDAAAQQGQANIEAAKITNKMNNPNVVNPYGTQTVSYGQGFDQQGFDKAMEQYNQELAKYNALQQQNTNPNELVWDPAYGVEKTREQWGQFYGRPYWAIGTGGIGGYTDAPSKPNQDKFIIGDANQPTITQTFSPEQQALYDQQVRTQKLLGGLGEQGATSLQGVVGKQLDLSGLPGAPGSADATRNKVIDAYMSRSNEDLGRRRDQMNSDLVAAGIRPGSKAYDDQMHLLDRAQNDAFTQAYLASGQEASRDFNLDTQRRKDALAELLSQRQVPLNEISALLSGSQVNNQFAIPGYAQNSQVQAAPIMGGIQAQSGYNTDLYNAQAAQQGNLMNGLFGLGSAGLTGWLGGRSGF